MKEQKIEVQIKKMKKSKQCEAEKNKCEEEKILRQERDGLDCEIWQNSDLS